MAKSAPITLFLPSPPYSPILAVKFSPGTPATGHTMHMQTLLDSRASSGLRVSGGLCALLNSWGNLKGFTLAQQLLFVIFCNKDVSWWNITCLLAGHCLMLIPSRCYVCVCCLEHWQSLFQAWAQLCLLSWRGACFLNAWVISDHVLSWSLLNCAHGEKIFFTTRRCSLEHTALLHVLS